MFKEVVTWRCGKSIKSKALCKMKGIKEIEIITAMSTALKNRDKPIKELKNVEASNDIEYNQLKLDLERIIFEENMALINSRANVEELISKRFKLENKLKEKEAWWELLELDYEYKEKVLEKAKQINLKDVKKNEYLRAWVVRITALSPFSFVLTWVTGEEIIFERGEIFKEVNKENMVLL